MSRTNIKNVVPHWSSFSGRYFPTNLYKYIGDPQKIIYRSSWEKRFCIWCDNDPNITKWASEPFEIQYISPLDNKVHEYFVDFYVRQEREGVVTEYLVEVKPKKQLQKPVPPVIQSSKALEVYNEQCKTYIINAAKFAAAKTYAAKRGFKFIVATEDFIFSNGGGEE